MIDIQHGVNNTTIVAFPDILQDEVRLGNSGVVLKLGRPDVDFNRNVTTDATVIAPSKQDPYRLKEGDKIAVSYHCLGSNDLWQDGTRHYRKMFFINGNEMAWHLRDDNIYAVLRDGNYEPVGTWVMLQETTERDLPEVTATGIYLPDMVTKGDTLKCAAKYLRGKIEGVEVGALVYFGEQFRSSYKLPDGEEYIILSSDELKGAIVGYMEKRNNEQQYVPLYDNVLLKMDIDGVTTTASGIIIPKTTTENQVARGEVLAVGSKCKSVSVGDSVLVGLSAGTEITIDGEDRKSVKEQEILCVVNDKG